MKTLISHWFIATVAILVAAYVVPGVSATLVGSIVAAAVLGALNLFIRPVIAILALPITIITLGLFSFVIDALLVMLVAMFVAGFTVAGFWPALFFSFVLTVINWVFHFWSY